jgi:phage gp29-like protein
MNGPSRSLFGEPVVGPLQVRARSDEADYTIEDRVVKFDPNLDAWRRYLSDSPTPDRFGTLQKSIDLGDYAAAGELAEEIEAKDERIASAFARRRGSLTTPEWSVEPDPKAADQDAAMASAEFCQSQLDAIGAFPDALEHNATAIGPGIALTELIWRRGRIRDFVIVPTDRLVGDSQAPPHQVNILTPEDMGTGIPALSPKFIINMPHMRSGYPLRVTPTRAAVLIWCMKHYARADWAAFSEVFGIPHTVAHYENEPDPNVKTKIVSMLKALGSNHWALLPNTVQVELQEAARSVQPFEAIIAWCDKSISILVLGQTLTTEQGEIGSLALGNVHANVEASIALGDIAREARTLRWQLLKPMVRFRYPDNPEMPIPVWKRQVELDPQIEVKRLALDTFRYMDERKLAVDEEVIYERLGVPMPKGDDDEQRAAERSAADKGATRE